MDLQDSRKIPNSFHLFSSPSSSSFRWIFHSFPLWSQLSNEWNVYCVHVSSIPCCSYNETEKNAKSLFLISRKEKKNSTSAMRWSTCGWKGMENLCWECLTLTNVTSPERRSIVKSEKWEVESLKWEMISGEKKSQHLQIIFSRNRIIAIQFNLLDCSAFGADIITLDTDLITEVASAWNASIELPR